MSTMPSGSWPSLCALSSSSWPAWMAGLRPLVCRAPCQAPVRVAPLVWRSSAVLGVSETWGSAP
eukprot:3079097-Pyramimonas_sp.AAC.1